MGQKIDVKKLKQSLKSHDIENILKVLDIPIFSKSEKEWRIWTGEKNVNALSGSPKLYYYPNTNIFYSYTSSCAYDIIGLVQARLALLKKPSAFMDAVNFVLKVTGIEAGQVQRLNAPHIYNWQDGLGKFVRFKNGLRDLPRYDKEILEELDKRYPQNWLDEGISIETMQKYQIGWYDRLQCTTIPVFDREGNLIGIRTRNWREDLLKEAKYIPLITLDETYKFNTNDVLFGLNWNWANIERSKEVIISESEKATMKLDTWYGNESIAVSMFGSNLGKRRRDQLLELGVQRVYYVADNDFKEYESDEYKVWQKKIYKFKELWAGMVKVELVWDSLGILGYKENATDRDRETWDELWKNKEEI